MGMNRRSFIKQSNCAAIGTASLYSTLYTLRMTAGATTNLSGYKALVCLFLNGGNDSYNMLMPYDWTGWAGYRDARGGVGTDSSGFKNSSLGTGVAIDRDALSNTILNTVDNQNYSNYAVHPQLPFLQQQFNNNNLAFVANVGTLVEPMTISEWQNNSKQLPTGLFSHPDAQMHWQTLKPQTRGATPKGWAGRLADVMTQANLNTSIGLNISIAGNNTMQLGNNSLPYITSPAGATLLHKYDGYDGDPLMKTAIDSILQGTYPNMFNKTYSENQRSAVETAETFGAAIDAQSLNSSIPNTVVNNYSKNKTAEQLAGVIKILKARNTLGMNRQMFFVEKGGFDHHNEVLDALGGIAYPNTNDNDGANGLFYEINEALEFFWNELVAEGLQNDVLLFTVSDFGRTLTSNGKGTDHAWGGNAFIMGGSDNNGGSLKGGKIYGEYPELTPNNNTLDLDIHKNKARGRMLPTTSADQYLAELVSWFGLDPAQLSTVFPNCTEFFNPLTTPYPLGILN